MPALATLSHGLAGARRALARVPDVALVAGLAALLILPGLGSHPLWAPLELDLAEHARALARSGNLWDVTVGGRYQRQPPLTLVAVAAGLRLFGENELGARFFLALFNVVAVVGAYLVGLRLDSRRVGFIAAAITATTPSLILDARLISSNSPQVAGISLAMAGFAALAMGRGARAGRDVALAGVGIAVSALAGGWFIALAVVPLAAFMAAALAGGRHPEPAGRTRDLVLTLGAGASVLTIAFTVFGTHRLGAYSSLLGGVAAIDTPKDFISLVKHLGFAVYPWSLVAIFGLGIALVPRNGVGSESGVARLFLLLVAAFGFAACSLVERLVGELKYGFLGALTVAAALLMSDLLGRRLYQPIVALFIATGTMILSRDLFLFPDLLFTTKLELGHRWPTAIGVGGVFLATGAVLGAGLLFASRAGDSQGLPATTTAARWRSVVGASLRWLTQWGAHLALGGAVLFGLFLIHWLIPQLSRHFSLRSAVQTYERSAGAGQELMSYRLAGPGMNLYQEGKIQPVDRAGLLDAFGERQRAFALVPASTLADLNGALAERRSRYFVLDGSSSIFLLLSNRLEAGEVDQNPLAPFLWLSPARLNDAGAVADWSAGRPPWPPPRLPLQATFGDAIELIGADLPERIRRPQALPLTLHFRASAALARREDFKIFVHVESGHTRLLGDHGPIDDAYATSKWVPGQYLRDVTKIQVPLVVTPPGRYRVLVGFWPGGGGRRLPVTAGPHDGSNRVFVGHVAIR